MISGTSNPGRRFFSTRLLALLAIVIGVALLAGVSVFTFWRLQSGSDAEHFNFQLDPDAENVLTGQSAVSADIQTVTFASLYPGSRINPRYWSDPDWAGPIPFGAPQIPDDFTPVSSNDPVAAEAAGAQPTRIRIPAIKLDSHISELELLNLSDQAAYQTPNNTVGHIPQTANPGQLNNGWYFGHLESFGTGEGSVFNKVPEIAELVRHDPVDIFIQTDDAEYMYRVTSTSQIHQDDIELTETDGSRITLCTCWPPRVYDRRVLVSAELIAVKRG